uniref:Uncharacterized protein n=1 Tax=viral metagenome TaxID=1070528 RepID=A0A6M3XQS8_9ZZZZ
MPKKCTSLRLNEHTIKFLQRHGQTYTRQFEQDLALLEGLLDLSRNLNSDDWTIKKAIRFVANVIKHPGA